MLANLPQFVPIPFALTPDLLVVSIGKKLDIKNDFDYWVQCDVSQCIYTHHNYASRILWLRFLQLLTPTIGMYMYI